MFPVADGMEYDEIASSENFQHRKKRKKMKKTQFKVSGEEQSFSEVLTLESSTLKSVAEH